MCCLKRSSGLYLLNQGHKTFFPLLVNKWFYTPQLLQALARHCMGHVIRIVMSLLNIFSQGASVMLVSTF